MSNEIKRQVDSSLANLSWTGADSREALRMMKGEIKVKKRLTLGMAIALVILMVGMAIAVAEVIRYSVMDYQKLDDKVHGDRITKINAEDSTKEVSLYLTDALFDGRTLNVALEIQPASDQLVYLLPSLRGEHQGKALDIHISGAQGMDFYQGFWVDPAHKLGSREGKCGFDALVEAGDYKEVNWTLRMEVLRPVWEIREAAASYSDDSDGGDEEAFLSQFKSAFDQKQILLIHQQLLMWNEHLPGPGEAPLAQRLTQAGAFEKIGELEIDFTTLPAKTQSLAAAGTSLTFEGFRIDIEKLDISFLEASYAFTLTVTDKNKAPRLHDEQGMLLKYSASSQGNAIRMTDSGGGMVTEESIRFIGAFLAQGEMPEMVTLNPYFYDKDGNPVMEPYGSFDLKLK